MMWRGGATTMQRVRYAVAACAVLAGCGSSGARAVSANDVVAPADARDDGRGDRDWRRVATPADRARLRGWRGAWVAALAQVDPREIGHDSALFDPDRSLVDPLPPAGAYRCRTFKLGAHDGAGPSFASSSWFACRIGAQAGSDAGPDAGANVVSLVKLDGSQRPVGKIYADTDARAVFLGTMELGDETRPMRYGHDVNRDMAGLIERIGAQRWRVVLPYPRFESVLDVVELVPSA